MTFEIKAIEKHKPGYPSHEEAEKVQRLLWPALPGMFRPLTVAFAGIVGACGAQQLFAGRPDNIKDKPNENVIQNLLSKYLKPLEKGHDERNSVSNIKDEGNPKNLPENPEIRIPKYDETYLKEQLQKLRDEHPLIKGEIAVPVITEYPINFDLKQAKTAAMELFKLYGVNLEENVPFEQDGVKFSADGYDAKKKIGFEIILPEIHGEEYNAKTGNYEELKHPADEHLNETEFESLNKNIKSGKNNVFVPPAKVFEHEYADKHTAFQAYLQSVLDYLEWLRLNGKL